MLPTTLECRFAPCSSYYESAQHAATAAIVLKTVQTAPSSTFNFGSSHTRFYVEYVANDEHGLRQ
ncbi:hypothetical protein PRIPAC_82399 [Pristionchus pacificus]|uniref:Uncharacterized protein n=1 Tax=Pristionchus pacificus TaxID=54126 RepID=A0A2A6CPE3_PRIPA|nr:hypothetical protein PRIPAC_82399 [Pristionchus pacificus]|eukprot:PDM79990.1 hypothetical protein PRIPAC_32569 [Pristionchus pacificus]